MITANTRTKNYLILLKQVQTKLLKANPNYPAYQQLVDYINDARHEYIEKELHSMMRKDIEEGEISV